MEFELREGVFTRTCNYVLVLGTVMAMVADRLEKQEHNLVSTWPFSQTTLTELKEVMTKALKETNQGWMLNQSIEELNKIFKQAREELKLELGD